MKHKWETKPRGKLTKYFICKRCNMTVVARSKKLADKLEPKCRGVIRLFEFGSFVRKELNNG